MMSLRQFQKAVLVLALATPLLPQLCGEEKSSVALSPENEKQVKKYMNILLLDPRSEFAFEKVYGLYEEEGKAYQLLDFFQDAITLQPKNKNLHLLLGMVYREFRDYYQAAIKFRDALKFDRDDFFSLYLLAGSYSKQNKTSDAIRYYQAAISVATDINDRAAAQTGLSNLLMYMERFDDADKVIDEILKARLFDAETHRNIAEAYEKFERFDDAIRLQQKVLELSKKDIKALAETHLVIAALYQQQEKHAEALQSLKAAVTLVEADHWIHEEITDRIIATSEKLKQTSELMKDLEDRIAAQPGNIDLRREAADAYLAQGKPLLSLKHLEAAREAVPEDVRLLELSLRPLVMLKRHDERVRIYEELSRLAPENLNYRVEWGKAHLDEEQTNEAKKVWQGMLRKDEKEARRHLLLAETYRKHDFVKDAAASYRKVIELDPKERSHRLDFVVYLIEQKKLDDAKPLVDELLKDDNTPSVVLQRLADSYLQSDEREVAKDVLENGTKRFPENFRMWKMLGESYESLEKFDDAIAAFDKAYDFGPNSQTKEDVSSRLINLHLSYGKWVDNPNNRGGARGLVSLILKYRKRIEQNPNDVDAMMSMAHIMELRIRESGVSIEGEYYYFGPAYGNAYYESAIETDPLRLDAYEGRANVYLQTDDFEKSVLEYRKLAVLNPVNKWKYYMRIGDLFADQGQMKEATAYWTRVSRRAFTDATLLFQLGSRYFRGDDPDNAIKLIQEAIRMNPESYTYHLTLGNIYDYVGQYSDAVDEFRKALQLSTSNLLPAVRERMSEAQVSLARKKFVNGGYQQALATYEEVQGYQKIMNERLKIVVKDYPSTLLQIARTREHLGQDTSSLYREMADKYKDSMAWVSNFVVMSVADFGRLKLQGGYRPKVKSEFAKPPQKKYSLSLATKDNFLERILEYSVSEDEIVLQGLWNWYSIDPRSGKLQWKRKRSKFGKFAGPYSVEIERLGLSGEKIVCRSRKSQKVLWEKPLDGARVKYDYQIGDGLVLCQVSQVSRSGIVPHLLALDLKTGTEQWKHNVDSRGFLISEGQVAIKKVNRFQTSNTVLKLSDGKPILQKTMAGESYWHEPVTAGGLLYSLDSFKYRMHAWSLADGHPVYECKFTQFFPTHPIVRGKRIYVHQRIMKQRTIILHAIEQQTGELIWKTDLKCNSLYAPPVFFQGDIYYFDPETDEILAVDEQAGGLHSRMSIRGFMPDRTTQLILSIVQSGNRIYLLGTHGHFFGFDVKK